MKSRRQSSGGSAGEGNTHSSGGGGGCKMERKDVEKNRRLHMKGLCLKLSSLLPPAAKQASLLQATVPATCSNPNKDTVTQLDHLENAAAYIKQLKGRIEELKRHQAAQGADRGVEASEGWRRWRWLLQEAESGSGDRRRAHAGDRGAVPGRDVGRGAHQRGWAAVQAARGDHRAGARGRRGRQRQLLCRRRQDLLHHPLTGAQLQDRPRGHQGLREAAGPAQE